MPECSNKEASDTNQLATSIVKEATVEVEQSPDDGKDPNAAHAIAETGTCVILPRKGVSRVVSLLPPVHVAIVQRGQVLPSLDEFFTLHRSEFTKGDFGSYVSFISGPSRSADIEYKLVTGVHGPGEVHLVLIG